MDPIDLYWQARTAVYPARRTPVQSLALLPHHGGGVILIPHYHRCYGGGKLTKRALGGR